MGIHNLVVQPVCLDERHTGVNHDKSDARELALRLDRYVAGNSHALATVRVPSPAEEQKRITSRQREQLKREVLRLAAQGRSLLLTQGYRAQRSWWGAQRWAELEVKLPAWLAQRLEVFRRLLTTLTVELDAATAALEAAAPALRPKGLGGLTYEVIEREVGDWGRFANRRQVASYTGLCGGVSASGQSHHLLPITKHGNVRLRTALVELAWRLVVWQRDCKLVKKWWPVLGNPRATKGARKKAIVAIARQLAVDCWRWRTGRVTPAGLGLGHGRPARLSRPTRRLADESITRMKANREDLKRRAPATALGLATARFGDWARPFLGCDRTCQLVPSRKGPCTDSR